MPHKDRETRLQYLRDWKVKNRPKPAPEPQSDPSLPPGGVMTFSEDGTQVQCHACGQWLKTLNSHIKLHGYDAHSYKEAFGLPRTLSMWPPATKAKQREAALGRDQGEVGRKHLPDPTPRPAGQEPRLGVRIQASEQRAGIYTRGGQKTGKPETK